jgi:hypothetical protein
MSKGQRQEEDKTMYQFVEYWDGGYSEQVLFEGTMEECLARFDAVAVSNYGEDGYEVRDPNGNTVCEC